MPTNQTNTTYPKIEPFFYVINAEPSPPVYFETAPIDFHDPRENLYLIPVTANILAGNRSLYTQDEINAKPDIIATENTLKGSILRINYENNGFYSVRSNRTNLPAAAFLLLTNPEKRSKAWKTISGDGSKHPISPYQRYVIFITPDEILFPDKKISLTQIRKQLENIKNKMNSIYMNSTSPLLSTKILEFKQEVNRYAEV